VVTSTKARRDATEKCPKLKDSVKSDDDFISHEIFKNENISANRVTMIQARRRRVML
jgi:hypothetical protein